MYRKQGPYFEELEEGTDGGGGEVVLPAADSGAPPAEIKPADVLAELDKGLGYGEPQQSPEEKAAADARTAEETALKDRDAKIAAGDPAAIQAKADADAKAAADAAKPKDLTNLEVTPEEKKWMKAETQARINDVLTIAKSERTRAEAAEQQATVLAQSRDAIMGVLKETNTTDQDLAQLLEYNRLVKSGNPTALRQALQVMDAQRLTIIKALGIEGQGYDPLSEHPDLAQKVAEQAMTKEGALEIVAHRKAAALANAQQSRQGQEQRSQEQVQQAHAQGLQQVDQWAATISTKDIDFKAKEAILLPKIAEIVAEYPPNLWLPTIKRVYDAIVVQKAPAPLPSGGAQPLRPSGAKPGSPAPTSALEALNQGLGYGQK